MADDHLGKELLGNNFEDVQSGGVGSDDNIGGNAGCKLSIENFLSVALFNDGLLDEVCAGNGLFNGECEADTAEDGFLALGEQAFLFEGIQLALQGNESLVAGGFAAGPHSDLVAAHCIGLSNSGAHSTGTQNGDFFDISESFHFKTISLFRGFLISLHTSCPTRHL